jgi:LacI family transcriptional regulator
MAVNQRQIAEKVGVSIALVSRVLSGKASEIGIAQDTIDRVMRTAEEMGYVPSAAALSLKGKATRTIGVAVYDFNDPFFSALIREIQVQAHAHDYSLVLAGFLNRIPDRQDLLALHKHAIDGLIVLGSDPEARWLDDFRQLPVARIGHGGDAESSVRITVDEEDAARQLVRHLTDRGRRRLACISCPLTVHELRQQALTKEAQSAGVETMPVCLDEADPFTAGRLGVQKLLEKTFDSDALVCATDQIAMGALHALSEAGIDVPGKVAVTGFDDIPAASQFMPPLTTIHQPFEEMVQRAFRIFMETSCPETELFRGTLVARETT